LACQDRAVQAVGLSWGDGVGEVWGRHREGSVWIPRRSGEVPVKVRCGSREGSVSRGAGGE
jgi:hypothetical protein